jgi:hypothetical protein
MAEITVTEKTEGTGTETAEITAKHRETEKRRSS